VDIARPDVKRRKRRRRIILTIASVVGLVLVTLGYLPVTRPPGVERGGVIIDTVTRGDAPASAWERHAGSGKELLYVQTESEGRVERILVLPGAAVHRGHDFGRTQQPDLEQQVFDLGWQLKAAEATLRRLKVQLESDRLTQEAALEKLRTDLLQAKLEAEADATLATNGLVPEITRKRSTATAEQLANQVEAEMKRLAISPDSAEAQLAVQQAEIEKLRAGLN
jgi:HlyD family secretion protein